MGEHEGALAGARDRREERAGTQGTKRVKPPGWRVPVEMGGNRGPQSPVLARGQVTLLGQSAAGGTPGQQCQPLRALSRGRGKHQRGRRPLQGGGVFGVLQLPQSRLNAPRSLTSRSHSRTTSWCILGSEHMRGHACAHFLASCLVAWLQNQTYSGRSLSLSLLTCNPKTEFPTLQS